MSRKLIDNQLNMMHSHMKNLVYDLSGKMEMSFLYNNYLLMARDHTISPNCQFDKEMSCEQFMTKSVEEFRERLLTDDLNRIINFLYEKFEQIDKKINDKNFACNCKWEMMRAWLRESLKQIDSNNSEHEKYNDICQTDTQNIYENIIEPIGNLKRFKILTRIYIKKQRFKELENSLNLQAGHLIYHLNPLKKAGYIIQDELKFYRVTEKGTKILSALYSII